MLEEHDGRFSTCHSGTNCNYPHSVSLSPASHLAKGKTEVCPYWIQIDFNPRPVHKHLDWTAFTVKHFILSHYFKKKTKLTLSFKGWSGNVIDAYWKNILSTFYQNPNGYPFGGFKNSLYQQYSFKSVYHSGASFSAGWHNHRCYKTIKLEVVYISVFFSVIVML